MTVNYKACPANFPPNYSVLHKLDACFQTGYMLKII